ncbi:hypothetical protein Cylst_0104 [Cylindrospermum stagnale PCC 7417]|uniref:Uncharacterized protein n=1 Tax=Cylindrospermum stagnale PCC 7417 TaxID=56107 RepID=K9WRR9_9NOST|nr:hypothetical protein [Cylindrospermum stagnale]AFZ22481.1 hypothetical protein Cylst_0104 [Cylindrospermum stagnale PCC 7417]
MKKVDFDFPNSSAIQKKLPVQETFQVFCTCRTWIKNNRSVIQAFFLISQLGIGISGIEPKEATNCTQNTVVNIVQYNQIYVEEAKIVNK